MPNRILKESINESLGLSMCSEFAIDLYKRLITYADDYGRFNADTMIMRARLYPREYEAVSEQDIIDALIELAGVNKIQFYEPTVFNQFGKRGIYGVFPSWDEHQRLRNTKSKCPDPDDTSINDWYLRRFIPLDLKVQILERDKFKCQICGKYVTSCDDAKRFVKLGTGLYHIDHIVPVLQGGRATLENLRLTCPQCNMHRKKRFTFQDLIAETEHGVKDVSEVPPQVAASCGELPQAAAIRGLNQNPNTNPNTNPKESVADKPLRARFTPPTVEDVKAYCLENGYRIDAQRFVDYYEANGWKVGKNPMRSWEAAARNWSRRDETEQKKPSSNVFLDMLKEGTFDDA